MKATNFRLALLLLLFSSIFALLFAYISQFGFGHQPCILCLYQRKPFFAIIVLTISALTIFKSSKNLKILIYFCAICLIINCAIAIYHVGVEQKIFRGPTTCSSDNNLNNIDDLAALKAAFLKTKAIRCDEPSFVILGFSMAALNVLYCLMLLISTIYLLNRIPKKNNNPLKNV